MRDIRTISVPIPKIMAGPRSAASFPHQPFHFHNRVFQPDKQRPRHDGVTDIEFTDSTDGRDLLHVVIVQAVAGMHRQAGLLAQPHRLDDARQFLGRITSYNVCYTKLLRHPFSSAVHR